MSSQHEDFQDYMDGGVRRRLVRHSVAKRPAAKRPVAKKPKTAVAKRRSPSVAKRPNMARLFGGFFESLEDFANETAAAKEKKDKVSESYADEKNPMAPLAVKGGKRKVVKPKRKPVRRATYGGFEEEEQSEEFMNINEALSQAKHLISGGYRHHVARRPVRPVARRPVRPVARRPVPRRPVARRFM